MQMPETPLTANDVDSTRHFARSEPASIHRRWPSADSIPRAATMIGTKRERTEELNFQPGPPLKRMSIMTNVETFDHSYTESSNAASTRPSINGVSSTETVPSTKASTDVDVDMENSSAEPKHVNFVVSSPTHRRVATREFVRSLVNEAVRHGHPTSEVHEETELGERIHVQCKGSNGVVLDRIIQLEIGLDVPEVIITEEQHLQFALQKLIDNAIKFTEHGTISISVKVAKSSQVLEIWVADTGRGISEESKSNLFQPHFQEDASIRRSRDGLGLSLFNAKAHVRKNLGGDVTLERSSTYGPDKGSEFLIRLPMSALETGVTDEPVVGTPPPAGYESPRLSPIPESNQSNPRPLSSGSATKQTPTKPVLRKRTAFNKNLAQDYPLNILIAEDNSINRNVVVGSLRKLGYNKDKITVAFDGLEAVKEYKASLDRPVTERFDAILMDIWMPNLDGYGATTQIVKLAEANGAAMKVIAVTADITEDSVDRAKAAGMQGFLAKPYKVFDLERLIMEHFEACC